MAAAEKDRPSKAVPTQGAGATSTSADPRWARALLVLLLVGAVVVAGLPRFAEESAEEWVVRLLAGAGAAVACVGLLVPWTRIGAIGRRLVPPQIQLARLSRVLGWSAVGALPAAAMAGPWWANTLIATLPFGALALWRQRPWSLWYWFGAALAALGCGAWLLWSAVAPLVQRVEGESIGGGAALRLLGSAGLGALAMALGVLVARGTLASRAKVTGR